MWYSMRSSIGYDYLRIINEFEKKQFKHELWAEVVQEFKRS